MQLKQIRQLFLNYFAKQGHKVVPSSSLLPKNDPTLLFTNAGMNQFKEVFLGQEKLDYLTAVTAQKCVRAGGKHNDLENVGYTARHHTFFEMLGNFSFGDYFKVQAIKYAWEFLTKELKIPPQKLYITVYHNDNDAYNIWRDLDVPLEHIIKIADKPDGSSDNFWQMGDTGPCGPCTEIFYDHGSTIAGGLPGSKDEDGDRYIEIWNCVFMQFNRDNKGVLHKLPKPSVDTGMGLERIAAVMQGVHSNYDIDLFQNLIKAAADATRCIDIDNNSLKVIADHIRSIAFLIADGVTPGNEGRGYVLRRIIRRGVRHGYKLGMHQPFLYQLVDPLITNMGEAYPELLSRKELIITTIQQEEVKFFQTVEKGMSLLQQELTKVKGEVFDGNIAFLLYDTYGFPLDLTADICKEADKYVDIDTFEKAMLEQKRLAKSASKFIATPILDYTGEATKFLGYTQDVVTAKILAIYPHQEDEKNNCLVIFDKSVFYATGGGQVADQGIIQLANGMELAVLDVFKLKSNIIVHKINIAAEQLSLGEEVELKLDALTRQATARNHSATHLLHKALCNILGAGVEQKGSLVTKDYLRFDFNYINSLTHEQLHQIELEINQAILANYCVETTQTSYDEAIKLGALALFDDKYIKDQVRVIKMGTYSIELCGGTHVKRTGDIGLFIINAHMGIASGVRRIEAITGEVAYAQARQHYNLINDIRFKLKLTSINEIQFHITKLLDDNKNLTKQLSLLKERLALTNIDNILARKQILTHNIGLVIEQLKEVDDITMMSIMQALRAKLSKGVIILVAVIDNKINIIVSVSKEIVNSYNAATIANNLAIKLGGKAGGKPEFARGSAKDIAKLAPSLEYIKTYLTSL